MINRFTNPTYFYFLFSVLFLFLGIGLACFRRESKVNWPFIILSFFIALAGIKAIRLMMPFGFFFVVLGSFFWSQVEGKVAPRVQTAIRPWIFAMAIMIGAANFVFFAQPALGIGLAPGVNASAEFFKKEGLKGPIFSNYDIGGYLVYHLADQEKVFVDNRQEAFPPNFFTETYIPMQENKDIWQKIDAQYGFNVIYFYRHDLTPWGQNFLIERIKDPQWVPVFVDGHTLIFLKKTALNQSLIDRFALPQSMFSISR